MKTTLVNNQPTRIVLEPQTGDFQPCVEYIQRKVSDLKMMFHDQAAVESAMQNGDPVLYEIRSHPFMTDNSDMVLGTTCIFPGKIGDEFHMTKGHFHVSPDQPEIYYCIKGLGYLQMMTIEGDYVSHRWEPGVITHIPPQFAHRVVNTGNSSLVFVSVYHIAAGHDYTSVEQRGFKYCIVERNEQAVEVLSPSWT